jgi:hypothetical protein
MAEWWSIEVFHADLSTARQWKDSYEGALIEAALANGALNWAWHEHSTGVVLEVAFRDDVGWEAFRALPAVAAALDAAPDPVNGLIIYRGRGGSSGSRWPRRRGPKPSAGAMALTEPTEDRRLDVTQTEPYEWVGAGAPAPPGF